MKSEVFNHNSKSSYALMSTISGHATMGEPEDTLRKKSVLRGSKSYLHVDDDP